MGELIAITHSVCACWSMVDFTFIHSKQTERCFYRPDALPDAQPTVSESTEWKNITFHGLAYPKLTWGS